MNPNALVNNLTQSARGIALAIALAVLACLTVPAIAGAQGTIQADDFNGSSLSPFWTLANPTGDASVSVSGGTANVSLPAGSMHDVWGNTNTSSGLRQALPDRDFEIEAKFTSVVSSGFQMQGLYVEQDSNDLVRAEVHYDGSGTRLFVATMFNGSPTVQNYTTVPDGGPVWMRVVRTGNTWRVRYSRDGSTWTTTDPFSLPIVVTRGGPLVGNSSGPGFTGKIDSFREVLPDTAAPVITSVASAPRTLDATVTWTTDEPSTSEVAYGPTTAYGSAKIGSDGLTQSHSVILHGLACGTLYHFQVKSKDASNNTGTSTDRTLTTAACPTAMQSDEFNAAAIDMNRWTLVDPGGGATVSGNGSQALISLPAGIQHDVWTGNDTVARLLQPAPNDDFELQVKYDSSVDLTYQMQGLIVEQDSDDLLRLEVHREGAETRLFAAGLVNGTASMLADPYVLPEGAPVFLRLRRSGNAWSFSYSQNGTTWIKTFSFTRAMTVTAAGLMAGNSGGVPPAFLERADWFHYIPPDRTPPVVSAINATPSAGSGARVTWTTDEASSSEVSYGTTTAYTGTITGADGVTSHAVPLHGLQCNTLYHYRVRTVDGSGNATTSTDRTFTSGACPTLLQSDEFNSTTLDTSKWAFIDPLGDSASTVVNGHAELSVPAGTAHDLWSTVRTVPRLLQAAPNADFEVVTKFDTAVTATTQQQGIVVEESADKLLRFETYYEGPDTKLFVAFINGGTASVLSSTVVPGGSPVYLKLRRLGSRWTFSWSNDGEAWRATTFDQPLTVAALGPYVGNGGNTKPAFTGRIDYFREITDRTPPVITQVSTRPVSRQAQITFTTDEPSSTVVEYRQGTGAWQTRSAAELQTRHSIVADGLACSTTYTFHVKAADSLNNLTTSGDSSFTTSPCTATGGPDVDVWNGSTQSFGVVGVPQTWVNVVGNVSDPDGVQSLVGRVNDGGWETLGFMPDGWRISRKGDFNYEVNTSELMPGNNLIELKATDAAGRVTTSSVTVDWQGQGGGTLPAGTGPLLVIVAHPDDESLGMAGVIDDAKAAGRRVVVAFATNGEGAAVDQPGNYCNAPADADQAAGYGLLRDQEGRAAMGVLGLTWTANLNTTNLIYLGYPGRRLPDVGASDTPFTNAQSGVERTYADDFDANTATCNGDFRWLLSGRHSQFASADFRADLDSLLTLVNPADVYTQASFDGHPDHSELGRQVVSALRRANKPVRLHTTIQHPEGDGDCQGLSSERWPNPSLVNNNPFARFTPGLDVTAPPASPCDASSTTTRWGPFGAPNELDEVPASMQTTSEATNRKWQVISKHESQIDCSNPSDYNPNCGYMRSFVKRREFFWKSDFGSKRLWPKTYTANWTSNASIAQKSQILEGQWRYEGNGVRTVTTGFDRALILGDMGWTDYDVVSPVTLWSFNPTTTQGAAVGLAVGWQGHNAWGQPRNGHPGGGLCLYAKQSDGTFKLQLGYSPGPVDDTILTSKDMTLAPGVGYMFRFRQQDGFAAGKTRYSCRVWRADQAEPATWDLQYDIPDWPGTTGERPGSAVLLAHEADATFGDTTVAPLP